MNLICIGLVNHLRLNELKLIESDGWIVWGGNKFFSCHATRQLIDLAQIRGLCREKSDAMSTRWAINANDEWKLPSAVISRLLQVQFMAWNRFYSQLPLKLEKFHEKPSCMSLHLCKHLPVDVNNRASEIRAWRWPLLAQVIIHYGNVPFASRKYFFFARWRRRNAQDNINLPLRWLISPRGPSPRTYCVRSSGYLSTNIGKVHKSWNCCSLIAGTRVCWLKHSSMYKQ